MKHILNLGAGVQSSTMAMLFAKGILKPMPDAAIFADTGWEPQEVYAWLDWLTAQLPFHVYKVRTDSARYKGMTLRDFTLRATMRDKKLHMPIPVFTRDGSKLGMTRRQCTRDWKIRPIDKLSKKLAGLRPNGRLPKVPVVTSYIGISLDEIQRVKPSRPEESWKLKKHPLVFELQWRRGDCIDWMKERGYPEPPRSACIGCPYHDDYEWWRIKQDSVQWADAVGCDETIRNAGGTRGELFLHHSGLPLVDAVPDEEPKRKTDNPVNLQLFNECEGMCGV